eukprot:269498-Rhodomonas_salina.2
MRSVSVGRERVGGGSGGNLKWRVCVGQREGRAGAEVTSVAEMRLRGERASIRRSESQQT